jgi:hypothetical protein
MRRVVQLVLIVVVSVASVVACGGPSKAEVAKQEAVNKAIKQFSSLRNDSLSGLKAQQVVADIRATLDEAKLSFGDIGTNETELLRLIYAGWASDAQHTLASLRDIKALPEQAKDMKLQFIEEQRRSERVLSGFGTSEAELNNIVNRNALEFIQRNGGKPTPAQYRAAGLPVPTITKTRTIIKHLPAKPTKIAARTPRKPVKARTGG